jgi:hypothetical protein
MKRCRASSAISQIFNIFIFWIIITAMAGRAVKGDGSGWPGVGRKGKELILE